MAKRIVPSPGLSTLEHHNLARLNKRAVIKPTPIVTPQTAGTVTQVVSGGGGGGSAPTPLSNDIPQTLGTTGNSGSSGLAMRGDAVIGDRTTAVTPGTYGDGSHVAQSTYDFSGRATEALNVPIAIAASQITSGVLGTANGGTGLSTNHALLRGIVFVIDGGGGVISTGQVNGTPPLPVGGTLTSVTIVSGDGTSGSITIDIWRGVSASVTTNAGSIVRPSGVGTGVFPALSSGTYVKDTSFTNWNSTTLAIDDVISLNVSSVTSLKRVTVTLGFTVT